MPISFFSIENNIPIQKKKEIRRWLKELLSEYQIKKSNLNYIFCSDHYLLKINQEFLHHNTFTDIITFDLGKKGDSFAKSIIKGEIYISLERVAENSTELSVSFQEELIRVMSHGVLHLLGFEDKTKEQKQRMRREEEKAIRLFFKNNKVPRGTLLEKTNKKNT